MTASFGKGARAAAASIGSVTIWKAAAAEAVADRWRNERREKGRECRDGIANLRFVQVPYRLNLFRFEV
jgi:hypothetical protein